MNFWSKHLFFSLRTVGSQGRRTVKVHSKNVNFHLLRHTYATVCIENGFDAKTVSELLGHSNVNITLNRYETALGKELTQNLLSVVFDYDGNLCWAEAN